jgi:formate--tetrahydrofolate ligase
MRTADGRDIVAPMTLRPIEAVADELGLARDVVLPWGPHRAKIAAAPRADARRGQLVLVTAINPTPAGEGKTSMSIALAMGLRKRGKLAVPSLREPSLGPVFGVKGGGTGGGLATIEPADAINLHFTGDLHAISAAHNLLAALLDAALHFGEPIDARTVTWPRVLDMNDRALRHAIIGLGGPVHGVPRETRFDITAASEVMAIFCLADDLADLERRLGKIVIGRRPDGSAVRASDIQAAAAMTALLRDAHMPNLVQTREGGPAFVHGGPFANIAHGCSSVVASRIALAHADVVVTEGGFGCDLGGEKYLDIVARRKDLAPNAAVIVATLRALKHHGGAAAGTLGDPNEAALRKGLDVLDKHLETLAVFGVPAVVALNRFATDSDAELDIVRAHGRDRGTPVAACDGFAQGGDGSLELADAVAEVLAAQPHPVDVRHLYPLDVHPEEKLKLIGRTAWGVSDVVLTPKAKKDLANAIAIEGPDLPVCVAKTHLALGDDPAKRGRPAAGDIATIREVRLSAGAGFYVALAGDIMTMPGLPKDPAARRVRIEPGGRIRGLMQND